MHSLVLVLNNLRSSINLNSVFPKILFSTQNHSRSVWDIQLNVIPPVLPWLSYDREEYLSRSWLKPVVAPKLALVRVKQDHMLAAPLGAYSVVLVALGWVEVEDEEQITPFED